MLILKRVSQKEFFKSTKVVPSPFLIVPRQTSFKECLTLMRDKSLSFLLIAKKSGELEGIVTLKDILKVFHYLSDEVKLQKPVSVVMSRPVKTYPSQKIHLAAEFMHKNKIRHLPIVQKQRKGADKIVGVIDMESLLRFFSNQAKENKSKSKDISVYSPDGSLLHLLRSGFNNQSQINIEKLWSSHVRSEGQFYIHAENYDHVIVDVIDRKSLHLAIQFCKPMRDLQKKMICIVDAIQFTEENDLDALIKLSKVPRVKIFEKPVNIHDLVAECLK